MAFQDIVLNGGSALGVLISSALIGIYILYKGQKLGAKLLGYAGVMIIMIGLLWLGPSTDFLWILINETNIEAIIYPYLSYVWVGPAIFIAMLIGTELIAPNKKKIILIFIAIVGIIFEIGLIFFPTQTFEFEPPTVPGDNIIDTSFNPAFFSFYALAIILLFVVIFNGIGSIQKAKESTGILRKKFIYLALGFIIFPIAAVFDTLVPPGAALPFVRITVIITGILLYMGLKP